MPLVTVACKLPAGLILQLYEMHEEVEIGMHTEKVVRRARQVGKPVKLNGFARYLTKDAPHDIRNGVGLTHGVDAEFFDQWMAQNRDLDVVAKGLVFAHAKTIEVDAQAKDKITVHSGLEPLNPNNLPLEFKGKISTADVRR